MSKNVTISEDLFFKLITYFKADNEELRPEIEAGLLEKLDAMVKRQIYTQYKTADTAMDREKARQEYLDAMGIPDRFRW